MTTQGAGTVFHNVLNSIFSFGTDFFAFILLAALITAFSIYFGRNRLMPLVAGIYAAIPFYLFFPFHTTLLDDPYIAIGLYLGFALLGLIAFSGLSNFVGSASRGLIRVTIISTLVAGALLAIGIHILPLEHIYSFNAPTKALFTSNQAFFWWLIAPLVGLFFLER